MTYLDSKKLNELDGKSIVIKFEKRNILGRFKKTFMQNSYSFRYNENPKNMNGIATIEPIFPSDKIPKEARNYHLMKKEECEKYSLENKTE